MPDQNYTETPNIKFKKPDPDRIALIEDLNGNFDKADEEFVKKQNKEEPTLPTEDKTILGAIIEIFKELWKTGSATQFGRFKVGKNLNVDENGFLNGNDPYSHPVGNGNSHLPKDGSSGKFIKWLSAGVGQWSNITWSDITGKPSSFTPSSHSQASNTITTMTGYTKPSSTSAIRESDSLNTAMGKLEKGLEGKSPNSHTHTGGQITQDTAHRFVTDTEKATWNNKLNRGSLPLEIVDAKGLYDLIENNSGLKFDKNLLFLTETGTKYVDNIYFDPNKKGLFKCIKQTTTTVNSTTYFVDISNEANSNKLENLQGITTADLKSNGYIKFSNGIIFQWGKGKTFPIEFPTQCLFVSATIGGIYGNANSNDDIYVNSISKTGFTTYRNYNTYFFAIGY